MSKYAYKPKSLRGERLDAVEKANTIIAEYQAQGFRLTLRQLYYQFFARGYIANTTQSYKRLGDVINEGRLQGLIDWDAIEDRTRALASLSTWTDPCEIVGACAGQFRVDMWAEQPVRVEVWVEKEALAGVVEVVCQRNRVPFLSCRGYTSQSEMWGAGMRLKEWAERDQDVVILHLGDHDPSGIDMSRDIRDRLAMFIGDAFDRLTFKRLALNMSQVQHYNPSPNPAKTTDSRYESYIRQFGAESWELDALEPSVLADLIDENISVYRDEKRWKLDLDREQEAKSALREASDRWDEVVAYLAGGGR
jgi:hypothetical protein